MKNLILKTLYLVVICGAFLTACGQEKSKNSENTAKTKSANGLVSAIQLQKMISIDFQIIDVRTPAEYESGHIKNALNINIYDEDFNVKIGQLDKSRPIVVYCGVGGRSGKAFGPVKGMGFSSYFDLDGGIKAWKAAQLPLE